MRWRVKKEGTTLGSKRVREEETSRMKKGNIEENTTEGRERNATRMLKLRCCAFLVLLPFLEHHSLEAFTNKQPGEEGKKGNTKEWKKRKNERDLRMVRIRGRKLKEKRSNESSSLDSFLSKEVL